MHMTTAVDAFFSTGTDPRNRKLMVKQTGEHFDPDILNPFDLIDHFARMTALPREMLKADPGRLLPVVIKQRQSR